MQTIIFSALVAIMSLSALQNHHQHETRLITGTVLDDTRHPLVGANVAVKGTMNGTTTDIDGRYQVEVRSKDKILVYSYLGYTSKEVQIGSSDTIDVVMSPAAQLDEVVITSDAGIRSNGSGKLLKGKGRDAYMHAVAPAVPMGHNARHGELMQENWNTEDYDVIVENKFLDPLRETFSTFSIDTDGASYSNLRRMLRHGQAPPVDAVRVEEMINYFDYEYSQPDREVPFEIVTELASCPWNEDHQLMHIGLQGVEIPTDDLPASNLVFLLDVSGSMDAPNKLPLVKQSFKMLVGQLREQDRVAIVVYAGSSGIVLPSTTGEDNRAILGALEKLQAGGGTAGAAGIHLAYEVALENFIEGGNNRVILATDGDFNIGVSSDGELIRLIEKKREEGVFLSVLGFGMGNYKDNKMQKLANHGNGNHNYIDDITEARKVFINEFGGTLFTIAKDVKIQVEFNPAEVNGYRLIGYENRMLAAEDFNDDKKDAGEIGSGHTVTALYEIIPAGVESEFMRSVDEPKFTDKSKATNSAKRNGTLMHLKVRYKEPDGSKSSLIEQYVRKEKRGWSETTDNFRWSAAVAAFGMILRESEFKGASNTDLVLDLAKSAKGKDEHGYRHEFIRLVRGMEPVIALEANK